MLLTTSIRGEPGDRGGAVSYARSRDLRAWEFQGVLFYRGNVGSPECPEMFRIGRRWYLLASFHTVRGVGKTSYRLAMTPRGPWTAATPDSLDGNDLCAGNTAFDGRRRLLFGWIPTYGGPEKARGQQWGGVLAFPREIYALPDGSLAARLPAEFSTRIRGKQRFLAPSREAIQPITGQWTVTADKAECRSAMGAALLPGVFEGGDLETQLTLTSGCKQAGFFIRHADGSPGFRIVVDLVQQRLIVQRDRENGVVLNELPIRVELGQTMKLRVILEGDIAEVFLDDRYSLATRLPEEAKETRVGICAEGGFAVFAHIRAYALR